MACATWPTDVADGLERGLGAREHRLHRMGGTELIGEARKSENYGELRGNYITKLRGHHTYLLGDKYGVPVIQSLRSFAPGSTAALCA